MMNQLVRKKVHYASKRTLPLGFPYITYFIYVEEKSQVFEEIFCGEIHQRNSFFVLPVGVVLKEEKMYIPGMQKGFGYKEYEKMMDVLLPLAKKVVLTEPNNSRKWDVDTLTETISHYTAEIHREKDIAKAYALAKSITAKDQVLCCAGSLYLIGELYKLARKQG